MHRFLRASPASDSLLGAGMDYTTGKDIRRLVAVQVRGLGLGLTLDGDVCLGVWRTCTLHCTVRRQMLHQQRCSGRNASV